VVVYRYPLLEITNPHICIASQEHTGDRWTYALFGHTVCKEAFLFILGIGNHRLSRHKTEIDDGSFAPAMDGRAAGNGAAKRWENHDAWRSVDSYCMYMYESMAEPLAETENDDADIDEDRRDNLWANLPNMPKQI
jgi:hypothetical protein